MNESKMDLIDVAMLVFVFLVGAYLHTHFENKKAQEESTVLYDGPRKMLGSGISTGDSVDPAYEISISDDMMEFVWDNRRDLDSLKNTIKKLEEDMFLLKKRMETHE